MTLPRLSLLAASLVAVIWALRLRPPEPGPEIVEVMDRARELLGTEPRPVGSAAHAQVRSRLVEHLRAQGAAVTEHPSTVCGPWGQCARLVNLVARLGPASGEAVAVISHYDSVPASPGAADDGVGVGIAVSLAHRYRGQPLERPLMLVLTDGEELGVLGAEALSRDGVLGSLSAIVNLEARGTSGPSLLFETTGATGPVVRRFAQTATRPLTTSLFDAIYQRLPNDTDLTVFRPLGVPGFNLAFIGDPLDYHTGGDSLERLSLASAGHQLALATGLVDSLLREPVVGGHEVVWFDVFGLFVVRLPAWAMAPLALLATAGVLAAARRERLSPRTLALGAGLALLAPAIAALLGVLLVLALHSGTSSPWRAWPLGVQLALLAPGAALGLGLPRLGTAADRGPELGAALLGALSGALVAGLMPGASYLWVVPSLCAGLAVLPGRPGRWAPAGAALVALALWAPLMGMLYEALGSPTAAAVTVVTAMGTTWLGASLREAPEGRLCAGTAVAIGLLALGAALLGPRHDAAHPAQANVVVEYLLGAAPRAWLEGPQTSHPAPPGPGPQRPAVEILEQRGERARLHVTSQRGSSTLGLRWKGETEVHVDGVLGLPLSGSRFHSLSVHGVGPEGVTFELEGLPERLWVTDEAPGLPPGTERPAGARPVHQGDRTRVLHEVSL
jgi:hypothetical protein